MNISFFSKSWNTWLRLLLLLHYRHSSLDSVWPEFLELKSYLKFEVTKKGNVVWLL